MSITDKEYVIDVSNLHYKDVIADASFQIGSGDFAAFIGPNGGGKSTTVKLLLNLLKKDKGEIVLFGEKIESFTKHHLIGYVPQFVHQIDMNFPISVEEVAFMTLAKDRKLFQKESNENIEYVYDLMKKFDIYKIKDRLISTLSGGQRQKAMIVRALSSRPKILILDEPNVGVDENSQSTFHKTLHDLNKDSITIIYVTHDLQAISEDVNKVFYINRLITMQGR